MAITYYFGFNLALDAGGFSLAITRGAYVYAAITPTEFASSTHLIPFATGTDYGSFAAELQDALQAAATDAGDPIAAQWTVFWQHDTLTFYVFIQAPNTFSAVLSADAQHVLGMAASLGASGDATSTVRPYYVIRPSNDSFKSEGPDSEAESSAPDEEVTDDGRGAGVTRTTFEVHHDVMQLWEPRARCEPLSAVAAIPWTWRAAVAHVRAFHHFVMVTAPATQATITYVAADVWARMQLRAEGAVWRSVRAISKPSPLDTHRHIPLRCRVIERLSD